MTGLLNTCRRCIPVRTLARLNFVYFFCKTHVLKSSVNELSNVSWWFFVLNVCFLCDSIRRVVDRQHAVHDVRSRRTHAGSQSLAGLLPGRRRHRLLSGRMRPRTTSRIQSWTRFVTHRRNSRKLSGSYFRQQNRQNGSCKRRRTQTVLCSISTDHWKGNSYSSYPSRLLRFIYFLNDNLWCCRAKLRGQSWPAVRWSCSCAPFLKDRDMGKVSAGWHNI